MSLGEPILHKKASHRPRNLEVRVNDIGEGRGVKRIGGDHTWNGVDEKKRGGSGMKEMVFVLIILEIKQLRFKRKEGEGKER